MTRRGTSSTPDLRDAPDPAHPHSQATEAVTPDANAGERPQGGAHNPAVTSGGGRVPPYLTAAQRQQGTVDLASHVDRKLQEADAKERYNLSIAAANGLRDPSARAQLILLVGIAGRTDISDEVRGRETRAAYWQLVALLKDSPVAATGPRLQTQRPGASRRDRGERR